MENEFTRSLKKFPILVRIGNQLDSIKPSNLAPEQGYEWCNAIVKELAELNYMMNECSHSEIITATQKGLVRAAAEQFAVQRNH